MLEARHPTATGLYDLPARFLKIGAPFFAAPIADMFNLSLSSSVIILLLVSADWLTTAALIKLIHEVTAMLESNSYVIVYTTDFFKAILYDIANFLTSIQR